ncbi:carotenoid oxygenase family protein [Micromonospora sp. LOL_014]|uniref:carotenoid oxygenase family protein n=1 Tax=Micromonospora sp. LOL_014 TaxID=3345415 RepID=UPI003A84D247
MPLDTALVMVLFGLRHNLASDVLGEVFGRGSTTVERYREEVEPLVDEVLTPLYERVRDPARRDAVLVDGLVAPAGERDDVDFGPYREAGEAVFVPRGPVGAEDDGWLLTYVYDGRVGRSSLVVLDAADFTGDPVAVVHLPVRVPSGFHANWITG